MSVLTLALFLVGFLSAGVGLLVWLIDQISQPLPGRARLITDTEILALETFAAPRPSVERVNE